MKKACTLILFTLLVQLCYAQGDSPRVRQYNIGQAFTSITLDPIGNVWAGTKNAGLWKLNRDSIGETPRPLSLYTSQGLTSYTIQTITANNQGGQVRVWAGIKGSGTTSVGGGIYVYNDGNTTPKILRNERNQYISKKMNLIPVKFDGTPSRNPIALATDPDGGIWAAHGYHDLTVTSTGVTIYDPITHYPYYQDKPGYYLTPGGLGYKAPNSNVFDNLSMQHMPYPAYTVNTPLDKTAGTRQCVSVGCGNRETWMGFGTYEIDVEESGGGTRHSGIAKFSSIGTLLGYIDASNTPQLPFTNSFASPRAIAIHWQKTGDPWIGFNQNKGFAVYKNYIYTTAEWVYVDKLLYYDTVSGTDLPSRLLPNGIRINADAPHAISSAGQRVFIGTQDGLLVYKGEGDLKQDSSYILITTINGLSSNNIKGVAASSRYIYAATDNGINEIFLPSDMIVFHVTDKDIPNEEGNYETIATLASRNNLNIRFNENDLPMIAADGTTSTVFRYYTNDFEGFYSGKYQFGFGGDYENRDTNRYGSFHLKAKHIYSEDNPSYVDLIYRHPTYIDAFDPEKSGQDLLFTISKRGVIGSFDFRHNMRIVFPPVLMVHGIWSSIHSFKVMENKLIESKQYKPFQLLRIFHENPIHPEPRFWAPEQTGKIPEGIIKLLSKCSANGLSAGRVDVLGHSRGGIMTRLYIQSQGVPYRDNVNKLITFNTPHAGSQQANWVCDPRVIPVYIKPSQFSPDIIEIPFELNSIAKKMGLEGLEYTDENGNVTVFNDDANGAWQLRVNDPLFSDVLNGETRLNDTIFKHAIQTIHRFEWSLVNINDKGLSSNKRLNAIRLALLTRNPAFYLTATTGIGLTIDSFLKHLFDGEYNDVIVPVSSQRGGLNRSYYTDMAELHPGRSIAHSNSAGASVVEDDYVIEKTLTLLKEPSAYRYQTSGETALLSKDGFYKDGFTPLKYTFLPNIPGDNGTGNSGGGRRLSARKVSEGNRPEDSYINIDSIQGNPVRQMGDTVTYSVSYGKNIKHILMYYEGANSKSTYSEYKIADSINYRTTFTFPVPKEELSKFLITAYGFTNETLISVDTSILSLNKPIGLKADSISIIGPDKFINLENGIEERYSVIAHFNDGISRDITYSNDIAYLKRNADIIEVDNKGIIKGTKEGLTSFIVKYDNQFDSIFVNVIKNTSVAQTYLYNFKGELNKLTSEVNLTWETFQEYKTKHFSVERSINGISFDSIGFVSAGGTQALGAEYSFTDPSFSGKNIYYRLILIDSTGKETSSNKIKVVQDPVVSAINPITVENKSGLIILPNPVSSGKFDLEFNSKSKDSNGILTITDLNGIKVFERKVSVENGFNKMNISIPSSVIPGIYIVDIKAQNNNYRSKLVIAY
ncbi:PGAP1 family protein [Sporocytophaga myxococcoides]|uniref:PGAP1 family protein n=1 Tax=Sporocytophaga myxococcoides TaxID=153721 RepID=A0A098LJ45_9BACT|nr:T9SS type A sorting domain-containing protein [Sporocytophaga myxococcoides]GAL86484.1 PGAP1 family protein [Sporocytophaga myxococcoides]